jgi:topoisomerase-4 subunit A
MTELDLFSSSEPSAEDFSIDQMIERDYLNYAMSVVKGRALPEIDGNKCVVRRILFAMSEMGLDSRAKAVKSARVVGDVLGRFHPHGDQSVYDAMVRIAQYWKMRYPLVEGQGNFGSRDGDGAAAMRYTEVRLKPIAELFLSEVDRGTVDFRPNYDGAYQEPTQLPSRLPAVLLNGSRGPGVAFRVEIPPHNLSETALAAMAMIRNPQISTEELLRLMPGPDFPTGGQIISPQSSILKAYETGAGSVRVRARWRKEELARGQWRLIISELPFDVSTKDILEEIETLSNPQPKPGKKEVSPDLRQRKAWIGANIDLVRNASDQIEPIRIEIEPKNSKVDPDELMAFLLAHTSLECTIPIDMVTIGLDGNPSRKSLKQLLSEWGSFRLMTVQRRCKFRLDEVLQRLHILEGRQIALLNLDEVIRIIREAEEPKLALVKAFGLSDRQAEDVLEIRLRQLARLEAIKIGREIEALGAESSQLRVWIEDRAALTELVLSEIEADRLKYADERRTIIEEVAATRPSLVAVLDEPITVVVSKNGWVRSRQGHSLDQASFTYKQGDTGQHVVEIRTTGALLLLDTNGRAYTIAAKDIPVGRGDGVPISSLIDLQAGENGIGKVVHVLASSDTEKFLFANSGGYGFIAPVSGLVARNRAGKSFMKLTTGESVLKPTSVTKPMIAAISKGKDFRLIQFPVSEIKELSGGRGVLLMDARPGQLLCVGNTDESQVVIEGSSKTIRIAGADLSKYQLHRARKGCQLPPKFVPVRIE